MCWNIPINGTKEEKEAFRKSVEEYRKENEMYFEELRRMGLPPSFNSNHFRLLQMINTSLINRILI